MKKLKYDPNRHYRLNGLMLMIGVILGLFLCFIYHRTFFLIAFIIISQYQWLIDLLQRLIYVEEINALDRLTNSAGLADRKDEYTVGRYRSSVVYTLEFFENKYILTITANGITNSKKLGELSNDIGAAFYKAAYLIDRGNGFAIYEITIKPNDVKSY